MCLTKVIVLCAVSSSHFHALSHGFMIHSCTNMCRSGFSHVEINAAVFISVRLHSNKHTCDPLWAWTRKTLVDLVLKLCVQINTLVLREVLLYSNVHALNMCFIVGRCRQWVSYKNNSSSESVIALDKCRVYLLGFFFKHIGSCPV